MATLDLGIDSSSAAEKFGRDLLVFEGDSHQDTVSLIGMNSQLPVD